MNDFKFLFAGRDAVDGRSMETDYDDPIIWIHGKASRAAEYQANPRRYFDVVLWDISHEVVRFIVAREGDGDFSLVDCPIFNTGGTRIDPSGLEDVTIGEHIRAWKAQHPPR